jgi:hypothetical protein
VTLADGMAEGRVLIASDDTVWTIVRRWADSPEGFIEDKIAEFASGNAGKPQVPAAVLAAMAAKP